MLNLLTLFVAITNLLLGLVVLQKNKLKALNISFFVFSIANATWALANYYFFAIQKTLLAFQFVYATGGIVIMLAIPWYLYLLNEKNKISKIILFYLLSIFVFVLPFINGLIINNVSENDSGLYSFSVGPFFNIYGIFLFLALFYLFYILVPNFMRANKLRKHQLLFVLIGTSLFAFTAFVFGLILPLLDITPAVPFDAQSSIVFVGFSAYAIIRHKFLDIKMVVARSVAFLLFFVLVIGSAYVLMMGIPALIFSPENFDKYGTTFRTSIGILMIFVFQPIRGWITKATDKVFFKNEYDFSKLLKKLTTSANLTLILIELLYKTVDILIKEMKVTRGLFVLLDEKGSVFTIQSLKYTEYPKINKKDIAKIANGGAILFDELEEGSRMKFLLRKYNASVTLGIKSEEGNPMGVLFLGEKESGDMYSSKDLKLFEILMPELSIAIHRAREHEKVAKFNIVLQQEVARQTEELQTKNTKLKELDKAKDEFISMASHQLRTPLTAIKGYLSMLLEGDAGEIKMAQYDFVTEAYNGAARMVGLINDLLNVSRMETGRFFIEPVDVNIEVMVNEEIKQLQNHAKDKKLYLKLDKKKAKIPKVRADETKLRQVVMNFIDNAIYYTQTGGVTVILDADANNLIFKVKDTGIGVPESQKRNLFTKFYRADNARRVRPDGTGLGIYLAKKVMKDHHGDILFESVEGKGSTFGFKMPLKVKFSKELTTPPPDLAIKSEHQAAHKGEDIGKGKNKHKEDKKEKSAAIF